MTKDRTVSAESLPFPPTPSASTAGRTMQESVYKRRVEPRRLPEDAPNILIVLIDDAGPGLPTTFGGEVDTPTMDRVVGEGIAYNRFHTTAMCSPTRASLLTGRNHHRVGSGQIAELANDWDGYAGTIPKSSALAAEVLKHYGYATCAFGKWHNTPAMETTAAGPFDNWPTGIGFEYFYGFLAGEASQYEPNLVRNTTSVLPPQTPEEGYHLSEDLADDAIGWLRRHQAFQAGQAVLHVLGERRDPRPAPSGEGVGRQVQRQVRRRLGRLPGTGVSPRQGEGLDSAPTPNSHRVIRTMPAWDSIPEDERPFQRRLMEVAAGFAEHVDVQVGRIIDELDALGYGENTLIFYIWGDNGSSAEGQDGTISELLAQNGIPTTARQHITALDGLGGLDALGTAADRQHVPRRLGLGWEHAVQGDEAAGLALRRHAQPDGVRWPAKIMPDPKPRTQFHHCNDIVPTIYEVVGINPPRIVNGVPQDPIDGVSLAYTFDDPKAEGQLRTQYFEVMGSRAIYHDGWMASRVRPATAMDPWASARHPRVDAG